MAKLSAVNPNSAGAASGGASLVVRDGSGIVQCVVFNGNVSAELFLQVDHLQQETSLEVTGTVKEHGKLDLVFSNAGVLEAARVEDMDEAMFERARMAAKRIQDGNVHC